MYRYYLTQRPPISIHVPSRGTTKVIYTVVATPDEIQEIEMAFNSLGIYFERKDV